jgi:RNA polymerase sigma-70 factor, ECF subfamily
MTNDATIRLPFLVRARAAKRVQPSAGQSRLPAGWERAMTVDGCESAVDRVLRGDVGAFAEIVERWQDPLVALAYRFCHDRSRAEDMAQEAFIRAFRALAQWRREAAFSTWLFALATNVYRSELRRLPVPLVPLDDVCPVDEANVAAEHEDAERSGAVRRALQSLPQKYRDALLLFYFHDMDVARAALSLGVPEGTVKARLSRGRDLLRKKLVATLELPDASPQEANT